MGMPIVIIHGTTTQRQLVGERTGFCGRCLRETSQGLYALEEREHVYFVNYGSAVDAGRMAACRECGIAVPLFERDPGGEAEAMVDAFLDAHHAPLEAATKSPVIVGAGLGIAGLWVVLFVTSTLVVSEAWACGAGVVLALLGIYAWITLRFRMSNRIFGREAAPRLAELRRLTGWSHDQIVDRADGRGYLRLRDYLAATWADAE